MKIKKINTNLFYVVLFDEMNATETLLKQITEINKTFFKNVELKFKHYKNLKTLASNSIKANTLCFIGDAFLLNNISTISKNNTSVDFILLISNKLQIKDLADLKNGIEKNSLNLLGYIPVDNNNPTLINFLIVDFIRTKLHAKK